VSQPVRVRPAHATAMAAAAKPRRRKFPTRSMDPSGEGTRVPASGRWAGADMLSAVRLEAGDAADRYRTVTGSARTGRPQRRIR
jgi:hypothetical protein